MGCLWSCQGARERCMLCGRKEVNNLVIIDQVCEVCIAQGARRQDARGQGPRSGPCYGEFRCSKCGRKWESRRAWPGSWMACANCRVHVYAHYTRPLRAADWADGTENVEQHMKELCQRCQQLGYDCAKFKVNPKQRRDKKSIWRKPYYAHGRSHLGRKPPARPSSWTKKNRKRH